MPRRGRRWIWAGRIGFLLILAAVVTYLIVVGPDKANTLASSIGVVIALCALGTPYLLPSPTPPEPVPSPAVHAPGVGAVAVGEDSGGQVNTDVSGVTALPTPAPTGPGVTAGGTGAVAIGRNATAPIHTKVTGPAGTNPSA